MNDIIKKGSDIDPKWKDVMEVRIEKETVDPRAISRPHASLLTYYILVSLASLPALPLCLFTPLYSI